MKIIFCGTNGWYDTKTGNTICILVETAKEYIILDAGSGLYKIDRYIKTKKPIYLFLSHFHLDHIVGLHILNKFNFSQRIRIYGQPGTKDILRTIINKPFTVPFKELPFNVEIYELSGGSHKIPFSLTCKQLFHSSPCFGYRIETDEKIITYCPDTGVCGNAIELAKEADLFIADCSYAPGQESKEWPHLNPEEASRLAIDSRAKRLVLVHFDASIYHTLKERKLAERQARRIFKNTFAAVDDMKIEI
jgi:ribonuclease BN (tRNA processing enzyme)